MQQDLGTPQGSIISPTLSNIYLNELDTYVEDQLKANFDRGKDRKKNPEYRRLSYLVEKPSKCRETAKELLQERRKISSKMTQDPDYKRVVYTRYADDFLVGIIGSKQDARLIKKALATFLEENLHLTLHQEKSKITRFCSNKVYFLGTFIRGQHRKEKPIKTRNRGTQKIESRTTPRISFHAPIDKILREAKKNGYYRWKNGDLRPTSLGRLVNLDHADIVKFYNSQIRGVLNYYSFVDNHKSLGTIIHGFKMSCAHTLALKYKTRTVAKIFSKFGKMLSCPKTDTALDMPNTFVRTQKFAINEAPTEDTLKIKWNKKLTRSNIGSTCSICGSTPVEMHHLKRIKDLKSKYCDGKID